MPQLLITIRAHESDRHSIIVDNVTDEFILLSRALDQDFDPETDDRLPRDFQKDRHNYEVLRRAVGVLQQQANTLSSIELREAGEWLFRRLLGTGAAFAKFQAWFGRASDTDPLIVKLEITSSGPSSDEPARRLQRFPWELMYATGDDQSWGRHPNMIFARAAQVNTPLRHVEINRAPLVVGFLGASPQRLGVPLNLTDETQALTYCGRYYQDLINVSGANMKATANHSDITRAYLEARQHILLMMFHGDSSKAGEITKLLCCRSDNEEEEDAVDLVDDILKAAQPRVPLLTIILGCRSSDIAHDLARRGMIAIASTGRLRREITETHIFNRLMRNLLLMNDIPRAVHSFRQELIKDLTASGTDSDLVNWQAQFIVCVMPSNLPNSLIPVAHVGSVTIESSAGTERVLNFRAIKFDSDKYGSVSTYSIPPRGRVELLMRGALPYRVDMNGWSDHVVFNLGKDQHLTVGDKIDISGIAH